MPSYDWLAPGTLVWYHSSFGDLLMFPATVTSIPMKREEDGNEMVRIDVQDKEYIRIKKTSSALVECWQLRKRDTDG